MPLDNQYFEKKISDGSISAIAWIGLLADPKSSLGHFIFLMLMLPMVEASMEELRTFAKNGKLLCSKKTRKNEGFLPTARPSFNRWWGEEGGAEVEGRMGRM